MISSLIQYPLAFFKTSNQLYENPTVPNERWDLFSKLQGDY